MVFRFVESITIQTALRGLAPSLLREGRPVGLFEEVFGRGCENALAERQVIAFAVGDIPEEGVGVLDLLVGVEDLLALLNPWEHLYRYFPSFGVHLRFAHQHQLMNNPNIPEFEFDTTIFKEYLKSKLTALFELMPGKKILITDPRVLPLLNLSIEYSAIQECGVAQTQMIQQVNLIDREFNQVLFMIPPKLEVAKLVAKIIKDNEGIGTQKQYMLVFWPQRTILCKELLETEGVASSVELRDFSFDLIPLDLDLLSLEMHDAFRDMVIDQDFSIYNYVAESINRIQLIMGTIPNIYIKGDGGKMVYDIMRAEATQQEPVPESTEIESLLIFDRSIDLLTPMLTQLIYEGLIDEFFGINGNLVTLDKKILGKDVKENEEPKTTIQLSVERDPLLYRVRNLLLAPLGMYLRETTEIQEREKEEFNKEKKNLNEKIVQQAKRIKAEQDSVQKHVNISTKITTEFRTVAFYKQLNLEQGMINGEKTEKTLDYVEAMFQVGSDLNKTMRLLVMRSLIDGGLKQKTFDYFRREVIHVYGFKTFQFLNNLQKAGMITLAREDKAKVWQKLQEQLKLVNIDIRSDDPNPKDCAYTYSGHCPLVARLVEKIFEKGSWKPVKSQMQLIPGYQQEPERPVRVTPKDKKPIVIIYMLGGVTYGEVSAFRLLGKLYNKEVIICTTNMTNGTKLVGSLREKF